jgi:predicted ATPase/DNA-binding winged helix-turn-helix (wHTH) protein
MDLALASADSISFGRFRVLPRHRVLLADDKPVRLGGRAFDLLMVLIDAPGAVVSKDDLVARVWPDRVVGDTNLQTQILALRHVFGAERDLIRTIPGRGYAFVGKVVRTPAQDAIADQQGASAPSGDDGNLPVPLTPILGRQEVIAEIIDQLPRKRLITIAGVGGIGKTAVALAVAWRARGGYRDGVQFVDLAPLAHASLVGAHLVSMLRAPAPDEDPLRNIVAHLQQRAQLIVLDNCEHVIDTASETAEAILRRAPHVNLLATSREPLRADGEWVQRLTPLAVPPTTPELNAAEALRFAAVQLFVEHLRAFDGSFVFADADARTIAEICARLDGLPLAIELAATRVPFFGLRGLADRLDDRFSILTKSRRTAARRHQTLGAMIDWSYEGLSDEEKATWRRLSVFCSAFTIEAAEAIAVDGKIDDFSTVDVLDDLLQKSLIVSDSSSGEARYRLLESLRLYAFSKLQENQEVHQIRRRHARYWHERSVKSGHNWIEMPKADWLARHRNDIADLRAALDWAFAPEGDPELGIQIVAASAPLWFKMLLLPELRRYLDHAIKLAEGTAEIEDAIRIRLNIELGHALFWGIGPIPEVASPFRTALTIAQRSADPTAQLQILWALSGHYSTYGDYGPMETAVSELADLFAKYPEPIVGANYNRIAALSSHLLGRQEQALARAEETLRFLVAQRHADGFLYNDENHKTVLSAHYCRILWMLGRCDQALQAAAATIEHANLIEQPLAFGYFLAFGACPIAIWTGNLAALRQYIDLLLEAAIGIPLTIWRLEGEFYARILAFLEVPESEHSSANAEQLLKEKLTPYQAERLSTFAPLLLHPKPLEEALNGTTIWCTAEILRKRGEILLARDWENGKSEAENLFRRAIDIAREQKALAWELRSATSLARLWQDTGRTTQARDMLNRVYERFTEGFATCDLVEAKSLLDALHRP